MADEAAQGAEPGVEPDEAETVDEQTEAVDDSAIDGELSDDQIVAAKSADVHEESSDRHVKVFVIASMLEPTEANGYSHEANMAAVRQYMLDAGLHPTSDVVLDSIEKNAAGGNVWDVTYSVPAKPAGDTDPENPIYVVAPGESALNTTVDETDAAE
jgi:hypothetical protein